MKIIHTADIHLGSKIDSKFPNEISKERKIEIRKTFLKLVEYAKNNDIKIILLSGDIFDSDKPTRKDKEFFYSVVENNPEIDFLYLKGNHDSSKANQQEFLNLKTFSSSWNYYKYGNVVISGIELLSENLSSYHSTLALDKNDVNIVMLHGQVGSSTNDINIGKLRNKYIDYLALGHIHSFKKDKIDDRGEYVYCGCLEPRGFDEIGEKGFVELEIIDNKVKSKFISFSSRKINEVKVDVSLLNNAYAMYMKVKNEVNFNENDIYRIILTGQIDFEIEDLNVDVANYLAPYCYFINVKDKTERTLDISKFEHDLSLRGEFVRIVYANSNYSDEEKIKIITLGLKVLDKKGVE